MDKVDIAPSMAMAVALGDTQVTIPADIDAAVEAAIALDKLATASTWAKASIVAAFVTVADGPGGDHSIVRSNNALSPTQFAAKGITGLKAARSVQRYARAWEISGHPKPTPGDTITLPDLDWSEVWSQVIEEMPWHAKPKADPTPTPDYFGEGGRLAEELKSKVTPRPSGSKPIDARKLKFEDEPWNGLGEVCGGGGRLRSETIGPDAPNDVWADAVAAYEADPSKGFMGNPFATPETVLKGIKDEDTKFKKFLEWAAWHVDACLAFGYMSKQTQKWVKFIDDDTPESLEAAFDYITQHDHRLGLLKMKYIDEASEEAAVTMLRYQYKIAREYFAEHPDEFIGQSR